MQSDGRELADTRRPVVAVYRDTLLRRTETYIRTQGEAVRRYQTHYIGMRRGGLEVPSARSVVLNTGGAMGRAREFTFLTSGVSWTLEREIRNRGAGLVHAHLGVDGAAALPLARRLGIPLVVTFHGYDAAASDAAALARGYRYRVYLRRRQALKRDTRLFIAVSEYTRQRMLESGFPEDRVVVHYIGIDTELFHPDPTVVREPVVLFVGRLIEKKGVTFLIDAMRQVQGQNPSVELVIIGKGELKSALERQAADAGVRARFLGTLRPEDIRTWMNRAQVLCMPSIVAADGDAEGLPIVGLEAMAMGLPIVASASAGIPEAITDSEHGLLARERDTGTLARHITTLLGDAPLRERLGSAALARVRDRFDLNRQTWALEDLYDRVRGVAERGANPVAFPSSATPASQH
jgi:colanic acid/amylovoran biosynthesis glycosyltransferase